MNFFTFPFMASPSSQSNPPDTYSLDTNSISTEKIKEGLYGDLIITAVKWMIEAAFRKYDSLMKSIEIYTLSENDKSYKTTIT